MKEGRPKTTLDPDTTRLTAEDDGRYSPPSLLIEIELEGWPRLTWNCRTDDQERRLSDWLAANDGLTELVGRAVLLSPEFWRRLQELGE